MYVWPAIRANTFWPKGDEVTGPRGAIKLAWSTEPENLNSKIGVGGGMHQFHWVFDSFLTYTRPDGITHSMLARAIPTQENGDWVVNPDGTMITTYRLRENARWHDGALLTAGDFVFGYEVYRDPDMPVRERMPEALMSGVAAPDDHTLVVTWREPYVTANRLTQPACSHSTPCPGREIPEQPGEFRLRRRVDGSIRRHWPFSLRAVDARVRPGGARPHGLGPGGAQAPDGGNSVHLGPSNPVGESPVRGSGHDQLPGHCSAGSGHSSRPVGSQRRGLPRDVASNDPISGLSVPGGAQLAARRDRPPRAPGADARIRPPGSGGGHQPWAGSGGRRLHHAR